MIETARQATAQLAANITYVCGDSVAFLESFSEPINLLYLNSFDCPPDGDATAAQQHNLRELTAAFPPLSDGAVVLLDDNRWANGGKVRRSKDYLHAAGWLCQLDANQSLWLNPTGLARVSFTPVSRLGHRRSSSSKMPQAVRKVRAMPRRNDDYHGGGSGWRFSWRIDRLRKLHELGRAFGLTEDSKDEGSHPDDDVGERLPDRPTSPSE